MLNLKTTIIPVVPFRDASQMSHNLVIAAKCGITDLFILAGDAGIQSTLSKFLKEHRSKREERIRVGVAFKDIDPLQCLAECTTFGSRMTWSRRLITHSEIPFIRKLKRCFLIQEELQAEKGHHLFASIGTACRNEEPDPGNAGKFAAEHGMIPIVAMETPEASVPIETLELIRNQLPLDKSLAVGSGITDYNIKVYQKYANIFLVQSNVLTFDGSDLLVPQQLDDLKAALE